MNILTVSLFNIEDKIKTFKTNGNIQMPLISIVSPCFYKTRLLISHRKRISLVLFQP